MASPPPRDDRGRFVATGRTPATAQTGAGSDPADTGPSRTPALTIRGRTGLERFVGMVDREFHPKLRGGRARRVYRQMRDNDALLGGIFWAIENLIRRAEWRVEPADESPEAEREAEFLDGALFSDMSHTFEDFLAEALSMLAFGWSYFEIVWKLRLGPGRDPKRRSQFDDGRVGIRKIAPRSQESLHAWEFDQDGGLRGMVQLTDRGGTAFIPIEKALLFRTTSELGSPEGRSILRNAYRSWYFKTRLEEIEAIGIERDLAGLPKLEVPPKLMDPNASAADKALRADLETLVEEIRRDEREGLLLPAEETTAGKTGYKFSLVSTGGRRAIDPGAAIVRHEQRMAISVLAEFLLLGMDKVGSFALASTKTTLFGAALGAVMDQISSVLDRFLVERLMRLNGVPPERWPRIKHGDAAEPDLEALSQYVERLVKVGALQTDDALDRHLRMQGGLPEREEAEPSPEPPASTNGSGAPIEGQGDGAEGDAGRA